jgi:hypothetical protein
MSSPAATDGKGQHGAGQGLAGGDATLKETEDDGVHSKLSLSEHDVIPGLEDSEARANALGKPTKQEGATSHDTSCEGA